MSFNKYIDRYSYDKNKKTFKILVEDSREKPVDLLIKNLQNF